MPKKKECHRHATWKPPVGSESSNDARTTIPNPSMQYYTSNLMPESGIDKKTLLRPLNFQSCKLTASLRLDIGSIAFTELYSPRMRSTTIECPKLAARGISETPSRPRPATLYNMYCDFSEDCSHYLDWIRVLQLLYQIVCARVARPERTTPSQLCEINIVVRPLLK